MALRGMAGRRGFGIESSGFPIDQRIIGAGIDAMMTEPPGWNLDAVCDEFAAVP
jgi:hypothetical protein